MYAWRQLGDMWTIEKISQNDAEVAEWASCITAHQVLFQPLSTSLHNFFITSVRAVEKNWVCNCKCADIYRVTGGVFLPLETFRFSIQQIVNIWDTSANMPHFHHAGCANFGASHIWVLQLGDGQFLEIAVSFSRDMGSKSILHRDITCSLHGYISFWRGPSSNRRNQALQESFHCWHFVS